ncbi:MAG TPA: sensor histidine kinase [Steroidobacteraceae bacterium]|jgi:two-component system sensor histidine kinase TctE|nr:sensor histidine kinase [Steroidobacteraceae bacterium]
MAEQSLRSGLLLRLGIVLVIMLALDALACYFTALHYANLVYDRWLIDSTRSLAQAVRPDHGRALFDMPRVALQVFQFDEVDKTYFRITSSQQGIIAGEASLPVTPQIPLGGIRLSYATFKGEPVRIVATRIAPATPSETVTVEVAETLLKRSTLAGEILLGMVAPQVTLLAVALLLAWQGVSRGLKPLTDLAGEIEARGQRNLSPVIHSGWHRETRVLATRINELFVRLSEAMRAQKRFVADAAHQLRTPLAAILLHAERAERATDAPSEKEALRALHRSVERAARLSQQLLSLARTEPETGMTFEPQELDLGALARKIGEEWIPRALERDVDFGLLVPDDRVLIHGDHRLLAEMLSNLIDNALRYGNDGGHVTLIVEGGKIPKISVQDDGPGIPLAEREHIFERFYRLPGSTGEGCGLGLAIVQEIARLHHSKVEIATALDDRGSRFTVCFEAQPAA